MPLALGLFQTVCSVAGTIPGSIGVAAAANPFHFAGLGFRSLFLRSSGFCAVRHGSVQVACDPWTSRVGRFSMLGMSSSRLIETGVDQNGLEAVAVVVQEGMIAVLREGTE